MELLLFLVLPGVLFLAAELLIVARTRARAGCFVLFAAGLAALLWTLWGYTTATGWDTLGWAFLAAVALSALAGALLGGGVGLFLRRRKRKKEGQNTGE